nr:hypothetical protein [Bacteroidota bacterium]
MKRKFIRSFTVLMTFAFITSVMAQQKPLINKIGDREIVNTITKPAPKAWENSTKDIVFSDEFPDTTLVGWTATSDSLIVNWISSPTNTAGGTPNEAYLPYYPQFVGQTHLISPVINTSGYTDLNLSFLHYIDSYDDLGYYVRVLTTSDGGATWNDAWELYWNSADNYAAFEFIGITTPDVGSDNFQFCFQFEGDSWSINYWAIDNIILGDPIQLDVTPTAILGFEEDLFENDDVMVSAIVNNFGTETVSFDVKLEIDDGESIVFENTQTVSGLEFGNQAQVDFDNWVAVEGT